MSYPDGCTITFASRTFTSCFASRRVLSRTPKEENADAFSILFFALLARSTRTLRCRVLVNPGNQRGTDFVRLPLWTHPYFQGLWDTKRICVSSLRALPLTPKLHFVKNFVFALLSYERQRAQSLDLILLYRQSCFVNQRDSKGRVDTKCHLPLVP